MITEEQFQDLNNINFLLNGIAAIFALAVVILILIATIIDRKSMDRLSIRFTLAISLVDFAKAIVILGSTQIKEDGLICTLAAFSMHWLLLIYIFLNVCIAVNLQLVFIHGIAYNPLWERCYWSICLFVPSIVMIIPLVFNKLKMEEGTGTCGIVGETPLESYIWAWVCSLLWILLGCIYCFLVVVFTTINLRRKTSVLDRVIGGDKSSSSNSMANVKAKEIREKIQSLANRISLYCIIPAATHIGFVCLQMQIFHTGDIDVYLAYFSIISSDLPGILNFLALLIDPAFINAAVSLKDRLISRASFNDCAGPDRWASIHTKASSKSSASCRGQHSTQTNPFHIETKESNNYSTQANPGFQPTKPYTNSGMIENKSLLGSELPIESCSESIPLETYSSTPEPYDSLKPLELRNSNQLDDGINRPIFHARDQDLERNRSRHHHSSSQERHVASFIRNL